MLDFSLAIFPTGALASSVITTVWVGVAVVCILNLRLGWVLSGLIVPGYLVPLMIIKPWGAATIIVESVVTYSIVWWYAERLSPSAGFSTFFGRDRFFALILMSVIVRVLFDGWVWPAAAWWFEQQGIGDFEFRSSLESFGLVIIALTANQFWKTGITKGMFTLGVYLGVTYVIVRYGLMNFTNFSAGALSYLYEDLALSILASPKSYIILLTAAFIASRMNLLYGWDFNGILLPSLLALQWYQPEKILFTFIEAFIILMVAEALLRTRWFAHTTMEGARKILLFFNIGFAWKMLLGFMIPFFWPEAKITDYYAFGYILSTLIAIKIHDKEILARLTRATIQTSFVAVVLATITGFALTLLPRPTVSKLNDPGAYGGTIARGGRVAANLEVPARVDTTIPHDVRASTAVLERVRRDKRVFYDARVANVDNVASLREIDRFTTLIRAASDPDVLSNVDFRDRIAVGFLNLGFDMEVLQGSFVYLREMEPVSGRGLYVINPRAKSRLLIEAPTAAAERGVSDIAAAVFVRTEAFGLALAGSQGSLGLEASGDPAYDARTYFHAFHRTLSSSSVLQIRRYNQALIRRVAERRRAEGELELPEPDNKLWIKQSIPPGLDLSSLKDIAGSIDVHFEPPPFNSLQRREARRGFAELMLNREGARAVLARSLVEESGGQVWSLTENQFEESLGTWLFSADRAPAERGSNLYLPPTTLDLLLFDEEIISPLLRVLEVGYVNGEWTRAGTQDLQSIARTLAYFNYELLIQTDPESGAQFLVLTESAGADRRYWGTYVLRLGSASGFIVQVPKPLFELGSLEYGVSMFQRLNARAMLIAGAHPDANQDGSADVLHPFNRGSLFNLINQALVRNAHESGLTVVQARGFGYRSDVGISQADLVVSVDDSIAVIDGAHSSRVKQLLGMIEGDGLRYEFVGRTPETAGYEVGFISPAQYRQAAGEIEFVTVRLSSAIRNSYRKADEDRLQITQFEALSIPTENLDLRKLLGEPGKFVPAQHLRPELRATIKRYQRRPDVVTLRRLQLMLTPWSMTRVVDPVWGAAFIAIRNESGVLAGLFNLEPRQPEQIVSLAADGSRLGKIEAFLQGGMAGLVFAEDGS